MENKGCIQQRPAIWAFSFCVAVALSALVFGWLRVRPMDIRGWQALLPAAVVALTVLLGLVWQHRVRAAGRWKAALDAYTDREIARDRRRKAPAITVEADGRNLNSVKTLKDRLTEELTDLAYPVVLRQGVKGPSIDVELAVWKAIDATLQEMLQRLPLEMAQTPPASAIVLARLTKAVYWVALRHGFRGTFSDVEFGLWDAFLTAGFPGRAKELLRTLFRSSTREALQARPARSPTQGCVAGQQVGAQPFGKE